MAIATRDQRFAMIKLNLPFLGFNQMLPDGFIDQEDRQQFLWGYLNLWASAAVLDVVKAILSPITMTGRVLLPPLARVRGASKGIIR